jgi:hypothetical protein
LSLARNRTEGDLRDLWLMLQRPVKDVEAGSRNSEELKALNAERDQLEAVFRAMYLAPR